MKDLTLKEMKFIELYTNPDSNTFGNATQSYIKAGYRAKNNAVARNGGSELLTKPYIRQRMEDLMAQTEIDFTTHLNTLHKKLNKLAETGVITREELGAIRLVGEAEGKLGKGNTQAVQVNVALNGQGGYDLNSLGSWEIQSLKEAIEKHEQEVLASVNLEARKEYEEDVRRVLGINAEVLPETKENAQVEVI